DEGAEDHHYGAYPDPGHERKDIRLQGRYVSVSCGEIDVEVLIQTCAEGDLRGSLLGNFVEAACGFKRPEGLTVFRYVENGGVPLVVGRLALRQIDDFQVVRADLQTAAFGHFTDSGLIERMARPPDEHQHDPHVDEIATVAARIAVRQLDHRGDKADFRLLLDGRRAAIELGEDGRGDEEAESEGDDRV